MFGLFKKKKKQTTFCNIRRFYEGGKLRGNNQDFYDANAPFEQTASPDRDVMRARARWLHENNAIIAGIDNTIRNNVVGKGLKFQSKTGDPNLDDKIEKHFREFAKHQNCDITKRLNFSDMQSLVLCQRMMDGEILIVKRLTRDKKHPLKLQLIEADRFDTSIFYNLKNEEFAIDGVEVDKNGAVKFYNIREPYAKTRKIPAKDVIHYFKMNNRATQYRGISEYKQVIIDLRNLAGFQDATLKSARARASLAYAVEVENIRAAQRFSDEEFYDPIEEINGAFVYYLNRGEKILQLDAGKALSEYEPFVRTVIRMIAVGRQVSYELAFRDYSQVNFSSARASIIQDHKRFDFEQWHLVTYFLNPLFESWMDANVLAGNIPISPSVYFQDKEKFVQPRWIAPMREWVDPLKDIKAIEKELQLGLTTLQEVLGARGKDLQEVIEQRKKEKKILEEAGIIEGENNA